MNNQGFRAVAVMVGGTIGAGIFAVPFALGKIGLIPGTIYLLVLGVINLLINLIYGEVVLRTPGNHQMAGYGEIYLGKAGKITVSISHFLGIYGVLLAYLIKIGFFLSLIFNFPRPMLLSLIFFLVLSIAIALGIKTISSIELYLVGLVLSFGVSIALLGMPYLSLANFVRPLFDSHFLFLPYGVVLFALTGSSILPEVKEILQGHHGQMKRAVIIGSLIPLFLYLLFAWIVVGICGPSTSDDAINGLINFLPGWIIRLGAGLGVLTITTAFLSLGLVLREFWNRDFKLSNLTALVLSTLPVLALFLFGIQNFIAVLGITGALSIGSSGVLIIILYLQAKKRNLQKPAYVLRIPEVLLWLIGLIFLVGMVSPWLG